MKIARAISNSWAEAHALAGLGRTASAVSRIIQAEALLREAHQVFQSIGAAETHDIAAELNALPGTEPG